MGGLGSALMLTRHSLDLRPASDLELGRKAREPHRRSMGGASSFPAGRGRGWGEGGSDGAQLTPPTVEGGGDGVVWCGVEGPPAGINRAFVCACNMCRGGGGGGGSKACWDKQTHNCTSTQNYAKVPQLHVFTVSICV